MSLMLRACRRSFRLRLPTPNAARAKTRLGQQRRFSSGILLHATRRSPHAGRRAMAFGAPPAATVVKPRVNIHRLCRRHMTIGMQSNLTIAMETECAPIVTRGLAQRMLSFPKRQPFWFMLGLNTAAVGGADLHMQLLEGRRFDPSRPAEQRVDTTRLTMFALFGATQAGVTWLVYINVFRRLFPQSLAFANMTWAQKLKNRSGHLDVVKQAAFDCLVYVPLWFYPNFYFFKHMIQGDDWQSPAELLTSALLHYRQNFAMDNMGYCAMWMPANLLIFSVPVWLRLPTSISFNYVFTVLLSHFRGGSSIE